MKKNIKRRISKLEDIVLKKTIRDTMFILANLDEEDNNKIKNIAPNNLIDFEKYNNPRMTFRVLENYYLLTNDEFDKYRQYSSEVYHQYKWNKRNGY